MKFYLEIFLVLVMFVVGLLNEDRIVVVTLEVHDLLVESTVESSPI